MKNFKTLLRKLSLVLISILILLTSVTVFIPQTYLNKKAYSIAEKMNEIIKPGDPGQNINITFHNSNGFFKGAFFFIGISLISVIILFFWKGTLQKWKAKFATIVFMIILFVMSSLNYSYHDRLWKLQLQALLDFILVFLGLVVLQYLYKLRTESEHLKAFLWLSYFTVCLFGILLPFLFGTLYFLNSLGITIDNINDKWITAPLAIISVLISWKSLKQKDISKTE